MVRSPGKLQEAMLISEWVNRVYRRGIINEMFVVVLNNVQIHIDKCVNVTVIHAVSVYYIKR